MRMLVTGTSGGIGAAVRDAAQARNHEVVEFNRADFDAFSQGPNPSFPEGVFDAVVFCTGVCPIKPAVLTSDELFAETIRINCGLFLKLIRHIVSQRLYTPNGLKIVAVSSISVSVGWPGGAAYCASKGALSALCRALDAEFSSKKISVKALEPSHIRTKMFYDTAGRMGVDPATALDPADFALQIIKETGG
jgi:NAD(P)-dependent dehydrogenase (short-subunit alcohol dehydrogenase family)